ncbi:MAG: SDR family oxidoreductase [Nitrospina sp.]|nr:SDR family oxidoreductase [Nitrospina sp.]
MDILTTGIQSGIGRYTYENLGGMGLARNTSKLEWERIKKTHFKAIIHCAFNSSKTLDPNSPYSYFDDNIFLTKELAALKYDKFIYFSTIDVYCKNTGIHSENEILDLYGPSSIYATSKLVSEAIVKQEAKNYLIIRSSTPLGTHSRKNTLMQMIENEPCTVGLSSASVYNIIIYSDILNFIKYSIEKNIQGVLNLASSRNITLGKVAKVLGKNIQFGEGHYSTGNIDNTKIASTFPAFKKSSEDNLLQYLKEHPQDLGKIDNPKQKIIKPGKKVLIVTGGSRGIGSSIATKAAKMGYSVCVNYRKNYKEANQIVEEINSKGGEAISVQADISSIEEVESLFRTVEMELGPLTALVNNAGISGPRSKLSDLAPAEMKHIFEVNLLGYFYCTKEAVKRMSSSFRGQGGAIVNISSQAAEFGGSNLTPYAASKAAINSFTLALSKEVSLEGIRVNAVSPGIIKTDQHDFSDELAFKNIKKEIPIGRLGTPQEVASAVLWLLSDEASYVTGAVLPVAGGR